MQVRLELGHQKANVKRVVLTQDAVIGRSPDCNLRIASNRISRQHCRIILQEDQVLVRDLGSSNGTFIAGERILAHKDVPVAPDSELSLGGVKFVVRYEPPSRKEPLGSTVEMPAFDRENAAQANDSPGEHAARTSSSEPDAAAAAAMAAAAAAAEQVSPSDEDEAEIEEAAAEAAGEDAAVATEADAAESDFEWDEEAADEATLFLPPGEEAETDESLEPGQFDFGNLGEAEADEETTGLVTTEHEADDADEADEEPEAETEDEPDDEYEEGDYEEGEYEEEYEEEEYEDEPAPAKNKKGIIGSLLGGFGRKKQAAVSEGEEAEYEDEYEEEGEQEEQEEEEYEDAPETVADEPAIAAASEDTAEEDVSPEATEEDVASFLAGADEAEETSPAANDDDLDDFLGQLGQD